MVKYIEHSKNKLLKRIHLEFPHLRFSKATLNNKGWDHAIIILDNSYVFRFPKNKEYVKKIDVEMRLLNTLKNHISINLPHYRFIAKDWSFGGYRLILGETLTKTRFRNLTKKQKKKVAVQIGQFLTQLYIFPAQTAKKIGLKHEWHLKDEKKEYEKRKKSVFSALNKKEKRSVKYFTDQYFSMKVPKKSSIIHHDLSDVHMIINKAKVAGIIDFGDSSLGDPAKDFSWLWELGNDFVLDVYKHYNGYKDNTFLQRSRYYNYAIILSQLYHGVNDKKKRMLQNALKKTRDIMVNGLTK